MDEYYQLGSLLCESREHYLLALCEEFMYAGGINDEDDVKKAFSTYTVEELTKELMDEWIEQDGTVSDIEYDEVMTAFQQVRELTK